LSVHGQFEQHWRTFQDLRELYPEQNLVVAAGNHDEILVESISSEKHLYNKYINNGVESEFVIKPYFVDFPEGKAKVVVFNPFTFPVPPLPLYLFAQPTPEMLDNLDVELKRDENAWPLIVGCHYPIRSQIVVKNSAGKTLEDILADNNVSYYLVGHFHMKRQVYRHINDTIEVILVPLERHNLIGVISLDNGLSVYSFVDLNEDYLFVCSVPPPRDQFTSRNPYLSSKFRVRFVVFDLHPLTLLARLDGTDLGRLARDFEYENYVIYGIDIATENGIHTLEIEGDISLAREFIVGPSAPAAYELGASFYLRLSALCAFVVFTHLLAIAMFVAPQILDRFLSAQMRRFGDWLFRRWNPVIGEHRPPFRRAKKTAVVCCCISLNLLKSVFLGPFYSCWRFHFTPRIIKVLLISLYIWRAVMPYDFVKGEETIGIVWAWGFTSNSRMAFDIYPFLCLSFFTMLVIKPLHFLAGLATEAHRWCYRLGVEFYGWMIPVLVGIWLSLALAYMGGGMFSLLTTPILYIDTPVVGVLLYLISREKARIRRDSSKID
jgi:hypothetical protein